MNKTVLYILIVYIVNIVLAFTGDGNGLDKFHAAFGYFLALTLTLDRK